MIEQARVVEIAREAAMANLTRANVADVFVEPAVDSAGRDALRVTIVITPGALDRITGDAALDTLVQMKSRLRAAGEERLAIIEYATEEELQESGDT